MLAEAHTANKCQWQPFSTICHSRYVVQTTRTLLVPAINLIATQRMKRGRSQAYRCVRRVNADQLDGSDPVSLLWSSALLHTQCIGQFSEHASVKHIHNSVRSQKLAMSTQSICT
jgi:hypothetical protein